MKINFGTINKFLLKSSFLEAKSIPFFDDLQLYYGLNQFIPEITINEKLEVIKQEKYFKIALKIDSIEFINVTIQGDINTLLFNQLIERKQFYLRDINEIIKNENELKIISEWECYKFKDALTQAQIKDLGKEVNNFYKKISASNSIEEINYDKITNTFYFKKTQELNNSFFFNDRFKEFLKNISLKYKTILFVNGLIYDWYLNPKPELGI